MKKNEIFQKALLVTGSGLNAFTDKEMGISQEFLENLDFLELTKISEINCPKCYHQIEVSPQTNKIFCKNCGYLENSNTSDFSITMNIEKTEERLLNYFREKIKEEHGIILKTYRSMFVCEIKNKKIGFLLDIGTKNLSDYYILKGYSDESNAEHCVMISHSFEPELVGLSVKSSSISLFNLEDFFNDFINIINKSIKNLENYNQLLKDFKKTGFCFKEDENLLEIKKNVNFLLDNLENWSLQRTTENSTIQGLSFQEAIVNLLNFTIFQAKLIAGKNSKDGVIYIQDEGQTLWFPFEIKTSKAKNKNAFYNIKEAIPQIEKYSSALNNSEIKKRIKCPSFLIIAYDFDKEDKGNRKIFEQLQRKYGMKYVLFPLKSLISLVKIHLEKIKSDAIIPVRETIEEFFQKKDYIAEEDIKNLYDDLESFGQERFSSEIKILKNLIEKRA